MSVAQMSGTRLAYVVHAIDGKVKRPVYKLNPKSNPAGMKAVEVEQPAGYMVYFPRGHAIRIRDRKTLQHYGLDGPASIINIQGLNDPKSPLGRLIAAQDDNTRRGAMEDMQKAVIRMATAKSGPVLMPEQIRAASSSSEPRPSAA